MFDKSALLSPRPVWKPRLDLDRPWDDRLGKGLMVVEKLGDSIWAVYFPLRSSFFSFLSQVGRSP